jgi:hypothetical protein
VPPAGAVGSECNSTRRSQPPPHDHERDASRMAGADKGPLARVREICLGFPEVNERPSHSVPTFFVHKKTFATAWIEYHDHHSLPAPAVRRSSGRAGSDGCGRAGSLLPSSLCGPSCGSACASTSMSPGTRSAEISRGRLLHRRTEDAHRPLWTQGGPSRHSNVS